MTLTAAEIEEIRQRSEKATPGPWFHGSDSCDCGGGYPCGHPDWAYEIYRQDDQPDPSWSEALKKMKTRSNGKFARYVAEDLTSTLEDGDFIAHSRQDIPNLLAHIDAQAEALRIAREALEAIDECMDDEIKCRAAGLTEEKYARSSKVYSLLSIPRNMARQALAKLHAVPKEGA